VNAGVTSTPYRPNAVTEIAEAAYRPQSPLRRRQAHDERRRVVGCNGTYLVATHAYLLHGIIYGMRLRAIHGIDHIRLVVEVREPAATRAAE
jgi:hypothetical protein